MAEKQESDPRQISLGNGNYIESVGDYVQGDKIVDRSSHVTYIQSNLAEERHSRLKYGKNLLKQGKHRDALNYFNNLKTELWAKEQDKLFRHRLLTNIGLVQLNLVQNNEAANNFRQALYCNPDDDWANALAAVGCEILNELEEAQKLVDRSLEINPSNELAHSLVIRISPASDTLEQLINKVPKYCQDTVNVLCALGDAALERKEYSQAEAYFEKAVERSQDDAKLLKYCLGFALLKPIEQKHSLFSTEQIDKDTKEIIERTIALFSEVVQDIPLNPNQLSSIELSAIVCKSSALWLLNKIDEAIKEIEIALQVETGDGNLHRQYAQLLYEKGEKEKSFTQYESIISNFQIPEPYLCYAATLIEEKRFSEAKNVIDKLLALDIEDNFKRIAQRTLVHIYTQLKKYDEANKISEELLAVEPNKIQNLVDKAYILLDTTNEENEIKKLTTKAQKLATETTDARELFSLAKLFEKLEDYRNAAQIYEKFVDSTLDTYFTYKLIYAYYYAGNYKSTVEICEHLLDEHGSIPYLSDVASSIYYEIGNLNKSREICIKALEKNYNNIAIQLRIALINYRTNDLEPIDTFLELNPNINSLSFRGCQEIIRLYKVRNRYQRFYELLYETRKRFYEYDEVHLYYFASHLHGIQPELSETRLEKVTDNCGVLLKNQSEEENWYIVENRSDSQFSRNELNSERKLYQKLLGKKIGDIIITKEGYQGIGEKTQTIVRITDKYFAAKEQTIKICHNSEEVEGFYQLEVASNEEFNEESELFKTYNKVVQSNESHFKELYSHYYNKKITFGTLAKITNNKNPIELWLNLVVRPEYSIYSYWNRQEDYRKALSYLKKGSLVVVDVLGLLTLYHLDIIDEVVEALGKLGISQSTFDLILQKIEISQEQRNDGYVMLDISMGCPIKSGLMLKNSAQMKAHFEEIIQWIEENCYILSSDKAIDLNKNTRDERNQAIGSSFVDTMLVASEPNRILLSEDQHIRDLADQESGTKGVWTQIALLYCHAHGFIDKSKFLDATLKLIRWGYQITLVTSELLFEGAKKSEWQVKSESEYRTLLEGFSSLQVSDEYIVAVAADFISRLYNAPTTPDRRDNLILVLLTAITSNRSNYRILDLLINQISLNLAHLPVRKRGAIKLIDIWREFQPLAR